MGVGRTGLYLCGRCLVSKWMIMIGPRDVMDESDWFKCGHDTDHFYWLAYGVVY